jgi:hypothetical protein
MLSIQLDSDLERRLSDLAKRTGQATSDVARELIEQGLEDLEDIEFAPDWSPIVWTQAERARGQAWGLRLPESFHTYGTPNVDLAKVEVREIPVFDPL